MANPKGITGIRLKVIHSRIRTSFAACRSSLILAGDKIATAEISAKDLSTMVTQVQSERILPAKAVEDALHKAEITVRAEFDGALGPFRVITRVDDVGEVVRRVVERVWCRDLENTVMRTILLILHLLIIS